MSTSGDPIDAILQRFRDGVHDERDIAYLKASVRIVDGLIMIGDHNTVIERADRVIIDKQVLVGGDAEAIYTVVADMLAAEHGEIPRGAFSSLGGAIRGVGLLVSVGSIGWYVIKLGLVASGYPSPGSQSGAEAFTTAVYGALIGAAIGVVGSFFREPRRRNARTTGTPHGHRAAAPFVGGGVPARRSEPPPSFLPTLVTVLKVLGSIVAVVGAFMFFSFILSKISTPSRPPTPGSETPTPGVRPSGDDSYVDAVRGWVVLAIGLLIIQLGNILNGMLKRR